MSYRKNRKRRRTEAFEEEQHNGTLPTLPEESTAQAEVEEHNHQTDVNMDEPQQQSEVTVKERSQKEQEVWDVFKEEQYEVLEQLPLSLHRSFTLMLELDQQVHAHEDRLLLNLQAYITLRKKLARGNNATDEQQGAAMSDMPSAGMNGELLLASSSNEESAARTESESSRHVAQRLSSGNATASVASLSIRSSAEPVQPSESTRLLLTQVAQLSEEVGRAANEKVNVARFAYDLVDRYIRDLDRAIKEQETSISLGLRPGTHPASIILPEVVPPRSVRAPRSTHEPLPADTEAVAAQAEVAAATDAGETTLGMVSQDAPAPVQAGASVRPRRKSRPKWSRKKKTVKPPDGNEVVSTGLKLTVPPLASILSSADDIPIEPNEDRWCYCNQVSFGEMIACDRKGCAREWFHLGCVGITDVPDPEATWYCRDCSLLMATPSRRKGR